MAALIVVGLLALLVAQYIRGAAAARAHAETKAQLSLVQADAKMHHAVGLVLSRQVYAWRRRARFWHESAVAHGAHEEDGPETYPFDHVDDPAAATREFWPAL